MKSVLLAVIFISVFAVFTAGHMQTASISFNWTLVHRGVASNLSSLTLGFPSPVTILRAETVHCCFDAEIRAFLNNALVFSASQPLHVCNHCSNDVETAKWEFPANTVVNRVDAGIRGGYYFASLNFRDIKSTKRDKVTLSEAKSVGAVSDLIGTRNLPPNITVESNNPEVMVWLGGPTDFAIQDTENFDDVLFACVDLDHNENCDFNDARVCNSAGGDWYRGKCCGVDLRCNEAMEFVKDGNRVTSLCGRTAGGLFQWANNDEAGEIHKFDCPNEQVVNTGTNIARCGQNTSFAITKDNTVHEYVCKNGELMECGGGNPFSSINRIQLGQKFSATGEYCASDGDFTTELDAKDAQTCTAATFTYTGSKCCGEPEDLPEFYNDARFATSTTPGGCYSSKFIELGQHAKQLDELTKEDKRIINSNGSFILCDPTQTPAQNLQGLPLPQTPPESALFALTDTHTSRQLLTTTGSCGTPLLYARPTGIEKHARCNINGNFTFHADTSSTTAKPGPTSEQPNGCCPSAECWNGQTCQADETFFDAGESGYYCQQGIWKQVRKKFSPDRVMGGFCPDEDQCLVHVLGNSAFDNQPDKFLLGNPLNPNTIPRCIKHEQFILDFICNNGNWTSRTKLLAVQLLSLAQKSNVDKFTISCDTSQNTLNNIEYDAGQGLVAQFVATPCVVGNRLAPCVNNFCTLKFPEGMVAVATSSNIPINDQRSVLRALNTSKESCNAAKQQTGTGFFGECSSLPSLQGKLWYNPDINSVVYLPQTLDTALADTFTPAQLSNILDFVFTKHNPNNPQFNLTFFNRTAILNTLFYSQNGDKNIFAFLEQNQTPFKLNYLGVNYKNINLGRDPCFTYFKRADAQALCEGQITPNNFVVISKTNTLAGLFADIGAKLRLV